LGTFHCRPGYFIASFSLLPWLFIAGQDISLGGHMTNFLTWSKSKMWNISGIQECAPPVYFGPSSYIIIDLNKP
jgi:hypothetical protein